MSYDYEYARVKLGTGQWDIENPNHLDGESNQIRLSKEIEAALPAITFTLCSDATQITVRCANPLTAGEEATLASTVADHKADV